MNNLHEENETLKKQIKNDSVYKQMYMASVEQKQQQKSYEAENFLMDDVLCKLFVTWADFTSQQPRRIHPADAHRIPSSVLCSHLTETVHFASFFSEKQPH